MSDRDAVSELLARWTPLWESLKGAVSPSKLATPKAAI
jgi:hypothetical protein